MKKSIIAMLIGFIMVIISITGLGFICCKMAAQFLNIEHVHRAMKLFMSIMTVEGYGYFATLAIAGFAITLIGIYYYHDRIEW
jgi:hypothetical protein